MEQVPVPGEPPPKEWRCFFCDEVFTNWDHAAEHFGVFPGQVTACKLKGHEGHLITYIRKLEAELQSYREDRDRVLLAMLAMEAEHATALRREEEVGFARGVADMQKHGWQLTESKND